MMKIASVFTATCIALITALAMPAFAASKSDRISVRYVPPKDPAHQLIYTRLKQRGSLERLQYFLSPIRLPETLQISVAGCDGEADAFYDEAAITICYEYIDELWKNMPEETTPAGIEPIDTVIGPFFEVALHEVAHALFDILGLPVLGREEDAADQVAAYIMLQFGDGSQSTPPGNIQPRALLFEERYDIQITKMIKNRKIPDTHASIH